MRVYYLDHRLSQDELEFAEETLGEQIEEVSVPFVLPLLDPSAPSGGRPIFDDELLMAHLQRAGVGRDYGHQVGLVCPLDLHWYGSLLEALYRATGYYPYAIQTRLQRDRIGNPGEVRIIDMHGAMGLKDE